MTQIVHCPKCQSAVSIQAEQAGTRVQCPSCQKIFLAPAVLGAGGASEEDEDWLSLAPPEPTKSHPKSTGPTVPPSISPAPSDSMQSGGGAKRDQVESLSAADLADEDSDNPFASIETSSPNPPSGDEDDPFTMAPVSQRPVSDQPFTDLFAADQSDASDPFASLPELESFGAPKAGSGSGSQSMPAAREPKIEYEDEYRIRCPICESMLVVKASQSGQTVRCGDCHGKVKVGPPPRKRKKTEAPSIESAATFRFTETTSKGRPADPMKRSAEELLEEASREEPDEEQKLSMAFDTPSVASWMRAVFGIFLDVGVIVHLLGLSVILAVPAAIISPYPTLSVIFVPLALLGITLTVSCGFAVLFSVANDADRVEDWPTVDPAAWFETLWLVIAATAISVGPAYVISTLVSAPPILVISLVMFCVYAVFPIVLLSMLDMQTVTMPFSADVSKSLTRCQDDWGIFYFSTGVLFAALFGYFVFAPQSPMGIGIGIVFSIMAVFVYFAILGRLAVAISGVVELGALDNPSGDDEEAAS
ncbi:zinc ribbon domain-containing protein [Roseiconus lacunae]|uniref:hypothetical protein n=1 Tax=Roseiconus lacunae TaxID=2605694 RepID=UPI0011F26355|nr:hypothetical protein [Roseiconus lacunae]